MKDNNELIPKLKKLSFWIFKFRIINRVSDPENCSETFIDVKVKIGFGMSSMSDSRFLLLSFTKRLFCALEKLKQKSLRF
jgi:hypothetical protein